MAIMVILFIILFSVSVAALSISSNQQHTILQKAWESVSNTTKAEVQTFGDCCGFDEKHFNVTSDHPSCAKVF